MKKLLMATLLLAVISIDARVRSSEFDESIAQKSRSSAAAAAARRKQQNRKGVTKPSNRSRSVGRRQQPNTKQTQQKTVLTNDGGESVPTPESQQQVSTVSGIAADKWDVIEDRLAKAESPLQALAYVEEVRKEYPVISTTQKEILRLFEERKKLEGTIATLRHLQSQQVAGGGSEQREVQPTQQPTPPAGGELSVPAAESNPFVKPKPVVNSRLQPSGPNPFLQPPQLTAAQRQVNRVVVQSKEALQGLWNSPWSDTFLGVPISNAPKQTTVQPTVSNPFPRPQPEAISEEQWQKIRMALIVAVTQPSEKLINEIDNMKNDPRLTSAQRDELIGFQQQIKAKLPNPFTQTSQSSSTEQPGVVAKPQGALQREWAKFVGSPPAQSQPRPGKTVDDAKWKKLLSELETNAKTWKLQPLLEQIAIVEKRYALTDEQQNELNALKTKFIADLSEQSTVAPSQPGRPAIDEGKWTEIRRGLWKARAFSKPEVLMEHIERIKSEYTLNKGQQQWLDQFERESQPLSVRVKPLENTINPVVE